MSSTYTITIILLSPSWSQHLTKFCQLGRDEKTRRIFTFATILISVLIFFVLGTYIVKLGTYLVKLGTDLFKLGTDLVKLGQRRVEQTLSILTTTIPIFVQKPDRSCQTRVICLLIFFVLGTDLVKLGRVKQTRSNVVTVGHSQIWTSLTQLRPNWYLDRRPLASHYKNNPSQISPSRPLGVMMVILIPLLFEQQWLSFSPDTSGPRKLWLLRDNNDRFSPYNKEGAT